MELRKMFKNGYEEKMVISYMERKIVDIDEDTEYTYQEFVEQDGLYLTKLGKIIADFEFDDRYEVVVDRTATRDTMISIAIIKDLKTGNKEVYMEYIDEWSINFKEVK